MDWWNLRCKAVLRQVCSHVGVTFYTGKFKRRLEGKGPQYCLCPPGRRVPVALTSRKNYGLNVYRTPNNCHFENVCDRNFVALRMHFKV